MTKFVPSSPRPASEKFTGDGSIHGQETARKLARVGRMISAIKWLESMNPKISRQHAKTLVNSFGYPSNPRWPQDDVQPERCL